MAINNLLVEANLYSATTRTKGCILTVQNSNAFSADTRQELRRTIQNITMN